MLQDLNEFSSLYRRFEDKFRGSQESITQKLGVYAPLLAEIRSRSDAVPAALDLGMGRGEWLRILSSQGWLATGVDSNRDMIGGDHPEAVTIIEGDALKFLREAKDASFDLITAFHLIEHLSLKYLIEMIAQIHRVLRPGGVVLFETPNPENLTVASWSFYMDPTHIRPLPPELVSFLIAEHGLLQPFVFRLNGGHSGGASGAFEEIFGSLFLSSLDYAVLAEKEPISQSSGSWRATLIAKSQCRPSDMGRLMSLARGGDAFAGPRFREFENRISSDIARIERLIEDLSVKYVSGRRRVAFKQVAGVVSDRVSRRWRKLKKSVKKRLPGKSARAVGKKASSEAAIH